MYHDSMIASLGGLCEPPRKRLAVLNLVIELKFTQNCSYNRNLNLKCRLEGRQISSNPNTGNKRQYTKASVKKSIFLKLFSKS